MNSTKTIWKPLLLLALALTACVKDISDSLNYTVEEGKVVFTFTAEDLRNYSKGNRTDLDDFKDLVRQRLEGVDSIDFGDMEGWQLVQIDTNLYQLTKGINALAGNLAYTTKMMLEDCLPPEIMKAPPPPPTHFGYQKDPVTTVRKIDTNEYLFHLKGSLDASTVYLSGSFNGWNTLSHPMKRTDSGWIAVHKLTEGKYGYKYIVDGEWVTDPHNKNQEVNEVGTMNSIFVVPNYTFRYPVKEGDQQLYLSGNFVGWSEDYIAMKKGKKNWTAQVYLSDGRYEYKFIADGNWHIDPQNPEVVENGEHVNSLLLIGTVHRFVLDGFQDARSVMCSGNFIEWDEHQLPMKRTATGWELEYLLPPGNYEYKFIVDGHWITDPANPYKTTNEHNTDNSWLVVGPTYTFTLPGFPMANEVFVTGAFVNWKEYLCKMNYEKGAWTFPVYLGSGKQLYKYQVDGIWMTDPTNSWTEANDLSSYNSVIWVEGVGKGIKK